MEGFRFLYGIVLADVVPGTYGAMQDKFFRTAGVLSAGYEEGGEIPDAAGVYVYSRERGWVRGTIEDEPGTFIDVKRAYTRKLRAGWESEVYERAPIEQMLTSCRYSVLTETLHVDGTLYMKERGKHGNCSTTVGPHRGITIGARGRSYSRGCMLERVVKQW